MKSEDYNCKILRDVFRNIEEDRELISESMNSCLQSSELISSKQLDKAADVI